MSPLDELRHSTAHVMATAVLRLFPDVKLDIGPPTETGFYYDFDLEHSFTAQDLEKIEAEMQKVIAEDQRFERIQTTREEAHQFFTEHNQPYKIDRLAEIPEGEPITYYRNGEFTDLCAGTHIASTKKIKAFKLLSIAAAYHKGDHRNQQLQRNYLATVKCGPNNSQLHTLYCAYLELLTMAVNTPNRTLTQFIGDVPLGRYITV